MSDVLNYLAEHASVLQQRLIEHISLSTLSIIFASCIAIPLGIWIQNSTLFRTWVLNIGSISQTIPSLAMLALLVPILGLGIEPTIVVLTFYAFYPLLQATTAGLKNIPPEYVEAADGLGFSKLNKLVYVELPLALPVIISGLRVSTSMTIGIATIAALIGAGGLGEFIMQGLSINDSSLILLGAIPTALLALVFDFAISQIEKRYNNRESRYGFRSKVFFSVIGSFIIFTISFSLFKMFETKGLDTVTIGSKNFNEQNLLAEIIAQQIEGQTNLKVERKFNLGSTAIVHNALVKGAIDLYPEYTGTAYLTILKKQMNDNIKDSDIFNIVKSDYKKDFNLIWLEPFGFSNSQSLAVKKDFATRNNLSSMSDLAKISRNLKIAIPPDYLTRPDGIPWLTRVYGFKFKDIIQVDPNLMYAAIDTNKVDVIAAFTTDGKLLKHDLLTLKDDKKLYPSYFAAPVIRAPILEDYPQIETALKPLYGAITNEKMQSLNAQVEVERKTPFEVARGFLSEINKTNRP